MHANETRVSQAFRGVEGRGDSHEELNPPAGAERLRVLCNGNEHVARCATAPVEETPTAPGLSEAQLAAFWAGIVANLDAARCVARKIVSPQNVHDVVHACALRFVESLQGLKPSPFPATDGELRALFLDIVRRYAIDCVRDSKRPALPIRSHWGEVCEPVVRGHNVPDRELKSVFARNDQDDYDAPAAAARREQDDIEQLHRILERHLGYLPPAQREILVESFYEQGKRADIAARRGITVSTYDNHRQAAFKALRESLAADVEASTGIDRSIWYDRIEELIERRAARLRGRSSSKKSQSLTSVGERGTSEGERGNLKGKRRNARGECRNVEGERRAVKGERWNSAHDRGSSVREGVSHEPLIDTSAGPRNEAAQAARSS